MSGTWYYCIKNLETQATTLLESDLAGCIKCPISIIYFVPPRCPMPANATFPGPQQGRLRETSKGNGIHPIREMAQFLPEPIWVQCRDPSGRVYW